jgi:peptidoglycan hydrolase-like protein with peptidoglycan-binding domain
MNIIERTYSLNGGLSNRNTTNRIILHHAAVSNCSVDDVDRWHKNKGWTCIGYHFFVRKDGSIYRGRREEAIGAHAYGSNTDSIGICAEGNFENETMGDVQKQALKELVAYLKNKYKISTVQKHKDVCVTSCPGDKFPFDQIANETGESKPSKEKGKIAIIQTSLNEKYGLNISVDNIYGNETKKALVKGLQTELNKQFGSKLAVDGIFGTNTYNACINVRRGAEGNITWLIQSMLICKLFNINADGIFGPATESAVREFQKRNGLSQDGIVGKNTFSKLFK